MANPLPFVVEGGGIMIGGEIEMNEFLEYLTNEELENLIEEIQEKLGKRSMIIFRCPKCGAKFFVKNFPLVMWETSREPAMYAILICPHCGYIRISASCSATQDHFNYEGNIYSTTK